MIYIKQWFILKYYYQYKVLFWSIALNDFHNSCRSVLVEGILKGYHICIYICIYIYIYMEFHHDWLYINRNVRYPSFIIKMGIDNIVSNGRRTPKFVFINHGISEIIKCKYLRDTYVIMSYILMIFNRQSRGINVIYKKSAVENNADVVSSHHFLFSSTHYNLHFVHVFIHLFVMERGARIP